jgi:glycosyltransferase 2 family protein
MRKILLLCFAIPLLWWSFRDIPFPEIYNTLLRINPQALLGLAMLNGFIFLLLSARWWLVIHTLGNRLPFLSVVGYRLAAFGITYFTPGPQFGGEPLQVHLVHSRHHLSGATALAGVTLDKLLDLLANFSFLVIGLILVFHSHTINSPSSGLELPFALGMLFLPVAYITMLWLGHSPFSSLLSRVYAPIGWRTAINRARQSLTLAEEQVSEFLAQKPRTLIGLLAFSLLLWILMIAEYWLALRILGIRLEPVQTIFALTAARIAFLLPFPAGLGALEAGQVAAMQMLGIDPALGIGVALLIRARDLSLGIMGLWLGGLLARPGTMNPPAVAQPVKVHTQRSNQK